MVDAAQPPNTADIEAQYDLHRAKREQQMEKLEVEVAEMRAEQALQAQLELEVKTVMPPRERAARERQLRQEAAEARRIAEAEAEAAKEAAKNGGVLRRKPAGGHAEGTLAARNAANILAQLLGPHELHKALIGELNELVAWAWAKAWQIHARQPASDNLDPDAMPQPHPRAPQPELNTTAETAAATASAAAVPSVLHQDEPPAVEGDLIANSSPQNSGSSSGGAFSIWALRRQVFRAFRAGEAGKARAIMLQQPRRQQQAALARKKRSGGVNLELQSRIVRQIRHRHFLRAVIAAEFRHARATKTHTALRNNGSRSSSREGSALRTASRGRGGSRGGHRSGSRGGSRGASRDALRGQDTSRGNSRDRSGRSPNRRQRQGSPNNRESPSRETRSRSHRRRRSVDFEVTSEPTRRLSSPKSPQPNRPMSPASPHSLHSESPRPGGGEFSPKQSPVWGFNNDDEDTPLKATAKDIAAAETALTDAAAALAALQSSSFLDASSSSLLSPGEIAWGLLRYCLAPLGSQRPARDSIPWRGVTVIEISPDGSIIQSDNSTSSRSSSSICSSSSGLDQGRRKGSRKTKSQQEQSTKSRAKKVVRGISSEQIGLIQELAANEIAADSSSTNGATDRNSPAVNSTSHDTTLLGRRRYRRYLGDNVGWVIGSRAVDIASAALWRALVHVEQDTCGQKRLQPSVEEKLRLEATARCAHPAHLPGLSCVQCGLVQPPAINTPAHQALAAAVAAGKHPPSFLEARYPSALIDGRRRLHSARDLMDFLVHELATRSTDGEVAKQVAENARAKLLHPAASFLQQAWRLRLVTFVGAVQSARLAESAEASMRRRRERLIRDVRYGDHTLARYAPPPLHLLRKPLQLQPGSKKHNHSSTAATTTAGNQPDSRGDFIAAAGVAVETTVVASCADARAPGCWLGTAPWVRDNFGVGLCRRAIETTFLLQACKQEGMRSAIALHGGAASAAATAAAKAKKLPESRPVTGSGSRATSPLKTEATTPRAATGMGGRRGGMTRAALEARYVDLTPKGLLDNFIAFEQMRTTLAGTRAVKKMVALVKQRYGARAAARLAEEKKAAEEAMAKLEAQRRRAEAAAREAGLSVEAHALELKREAQAAEKARMERRLANMAHAANASRESKECFYCRRPECCKPKASSPTSSSASDDSRPKEAQIDPAFVRAGAVSKQALAAAKDAASMMPRVFTDARQFQIHVRWHEREDRAEIEAAREKAEVIAARQRAEDDFLAFTKQARAARVVEEKRWAAAEKAVMAEEFAAALGANEVPGLENYRDLAIEDLPPPQQPTRQEQDAPSSFSPPQPLMLPESSAATRAAQPPAAVTTANFRRSERERVQSHNLHSSRRRRQGHSDDNSDLAAELALALESPRLPSSRRSSAEDNDEDDSNNGSEATGTDRSQHRRRDGRNLGRHNDYGAPDTAVSAAAPMNDDDTTSSSDSSSSSTAVGGMLAEGMRNERFGNRARRRTVAADAAARKAAEMRHHSHALMGPAVAGLAGDVSSADAAPAALTVAGRKSGEPHGNAADVASSGKSRGSGSGRRIVAAVGRGETAGAPGVGMNDDSSDDSDNDENVNGRRSEGIKGRGNRHTKGDDARQWRHLVPEDEALEDKAARKRFAAKQQRHVWTPAAALHSQAAALNRKKLETEANKRLEGGDQAAYLDHRAYMLLSTSSSSNGDATTLHDAEAAATHVRALSLAVGAVARRPGQAAASTKGGNAYQTDQLAKLDALLQQQQKHAPAGDLAVKLKMHRARVTTAAAAVSAGPSLARFPPVARNYDNDSDDDDSSDNGGDLGRSVVRKSRRSNMIHAAPTTGAALKVTRAPVPLPLPPHEVPYLELTHSALLPSEDHSTREVGGDGGSSGHGSGSSDLLARRVVLGNVINRLGRSRTCDVCIEGPLNTLRNSIGLAADEIASHFSDVHALIRVDLEPSTNPGTESSNNEAPSYEVSCYDHFAVSSSSSASSYSSINGSTGDDRLSSDGSGSAGVWLLGMTGGVRAAPKPLEFKTPEGPKRGRLKHGDSLMIASQQHGGGGGFSSGYQLVYRLVVPSAARSAAHPRAQSAAVAIADLAHGTSKCTTPTGNSSSQDALDTFLSVQK